MYPWKHWPLRAAAELLASDLDEIMRADQILWGHGGNSGSGSGNIGEQYGVTNAMHRGGSREKEQEMRSLVNSTDDDEDGAEVISFETNRGSSGHALDNSTYNTSFNYNNNNGGTI